MIRSPTRFPRNTAAPGRFSRFALAAATYAGRPVTFALAVAATSVWLVAGLYFDFSDTWQLTASTATSVITFLMVFIIQHTQNRETRAVQIKLAELILVIRGTRDYLAAVETLPDETLDQLTRAYSQKAREAQGAPGGMEWGDADEEPPPADAHRRDPPE